LACDIEGGELKCLKGIDLNIYRPYIIMVENGGGCKPHADPELHNYLKSKNYTLDIALSYNFFYVDSTVSK